MCKTRDGGAACGGDKVCLFFFANQKDMKETNRERLEHKYCIERNRWVKKICKEEISHLAFGLANTFHMM